MSTKKEISSADDLYNEFLKLEELNSFLCHPSCLYIIIFEMHNQISKVRDTIKTEDLEFLHTFTTVAQSMYEEIREKCASTKFVIEFYHNYREFTESYDFVSRRNDIAKEGE